MDTTKDPLEKLLSEEVPKAMEKWLRDRAEDPLHDVDIENEVAHFAYSLLRSNEAMLPELRKGIII